MLTVAPGILGFLSKDIVFSFSFMSILNLTGVNIKARLILLLLPVSLWLRHAHPTPQRSKNKVPQTALPQVTWHASYPPRFLSFSQDNTTKEATWNPENMATHRLEIPSIPSLDVRIRAGETEDSCGGNKSPLLILVLRDGCLIVAPLRTVSVGVAQHPFSSLYFYFSPLPTVSICVVSQWSLHKPVSIRVVLGFCFM